ncbi:hypothetical protein Tco_0438586 [Tanacetum coccineum]
MRGYRTHLISFEGTDSNVYEMILSNGFRHRHLCLDGNFVVVEYDDEERNEEGRRRDDEEGGFDKEEDDGGSAEDVAFLLAEKRNGGIIALQGGRGVGFLAGCRAGGHEGPGIWVGGRTEGPWVKLLELNQMSYLKS